MANKPTVRIIGGATRIDAAIALLTSDAEMKGSISHVQHAAELASDEHPAADAARALAEHANAVLILQRRAIRALGEACSTELKALARRIADLEAGQ